MSENSMNHLNDSELEKVAGGYGEGYGSSGSFASNSGTALNLFVSWQVQGDAYGQRVLSVDVYATSYSLTSSSSSVQLSVNGEIYSAWSSPISYSGSTQAANHLASFTVPMYTAAANVAAVWHFNGMYSGMPVGDIVASGTVYA